jgi:RNA polymerase sigma factor (sigma-70 family)
MTYDAEDLVHDTYYRVLSHPKHPDGIRNPKAYLLRTMRNMWIDNWKRDNKRNTESLELLKNRSEAINQYFVIPCVLKNLENEDLMRQFDNRQGQLTSRERTLLKLHLDGYSAKDIAFSLKEDLSRTRIDLNAVRAKIRYRLKNSKSANRK